MGCWGILVDMIVETDSCIYRRETTADNNSTKPRWVLIVDSLIIVIEQDLLIFGSGYK